MARCLCTLVFVVVCTLANASQLTVSTNSNDWHVNPKRVATPIIVTDTVTTEMPVVVTPTDTVTTSVISVPTDTVMVERPVISVPTDTVRVEAPAEGDERNIEEELRNNYRERRQALREQQREARRQREQQRREARERQRNLAEQQRLEIAQNRQARATADSIAQANEALRTAFVATLDSVTTASDESQEAAHVNYNRIPLPEDSVVANMRAEYNSERRHTYNLIREEARVHDMPNGMFKRWLRYFTGKTYGQAYITACDEADTVNTYQRAMMFDADTLRQMYRNRGMTTLVNRLISLRERAHTLNLQLSKTRERNRAAQRTVATYATLQHAIDSMGEIALQNDIRYLAERYPNEVTIDRAFRRADQRNRRIMRELDQRVRMGLPIDAADGFGKEDMRLLWRKDSIMTMWSDSLSARSVWHQLSFHTNGIGWLLGVPNVGVEFDLSGKPSNRWSVLARAYFKPNVNRLHTNPSFNFNVRSGNVEVRKYWRFGQVRNVRSMRTWTERLGDDYERLHRREREAIIDTTSGPIDVITGQRIPITVRAARSVEESQYRTRLYLGEGYYWQVEPSNERDIYGIDSLTLKLRDFVQEDSTVTHSTERNIWTDSYLRRFWEPVRYNGLSHRFVGEDSRVRTDLRYYLGAMVGYEEYHWILGSKGRQGKAAYGCVTAGVVMPLRHGTRFDIDFGIALGVQMTTYTKFHYVSETRCYAFTSTNRRHITPYPVVKDLHVSLVYSLTPTTNKTHNLFLTDEFSYRMNRVSWHNEQAKDIRRRHHEKRARLRVQREVDRWMRYQQERRQQEAIHTYNRVSEIMAADPTLSREQASARLRQMINDTNTLNERRNDRQYVLPEGVGVIIEATDEDL